MKRTTEKYFVENFHLHSPVEEFQEHCRLEIDRLHAENPNVDDTLFRQATDLVLRKLKTKRVSSES